MINWFLNRQVCSVNRFSPTLSLKITNPQTGKCFLARALYDSGSDISFISRILATSLEISAVYKTSVQLTSLDDPQVTAPADVRILNQRRLLPASLFPVAPAQLRSAIKKGLDIEIHDNAANIPIDIIIGTDLFTAIFMSTNDRRIQLTDNLHLIQTKFGFMLQGFAT